MQFNSRKWWKYIVIDLQCSFKNIHEAFWRLMGPIVVVLQAKCFLCCTKCLQRLIGLACKWTSFSKKPCCCCWNKHGLPWKRWMSPYTVAAPAYIVQLHSYCHAAHANMKPSFALCYDNENRRSTGDLSRVNPASRPMTAGIGSSPPATRPTD